MKRRYLSPLTLRILAVNALALVLLVMALLYMGRYRDRLVMAEYQALTREAQIFAGAIAEGATLLDENSNEFLSAQLTRQMVRRLSETTQTRTRLYVAPQGKLIADSQMLTGNGERVQIEFLGETIDDGVRDWWHQLFNLYEDVVNHLPLFQSMPSYTEVDSTTPASVLDENIKNTLAHGAVVPQLWRGEQHIIFSVTVPVQRYKQIMGAVMVSRSGQKVEEAIRAVRLDILRVLLLSLAITTLLSFYLARTIARPITQLAVAADRIRISQGRQLRLPDFSHRHDEIGDLAAAFAAMTKALQARLDVIESFAADVAHELKNPLTSLRSAAETVLKVKDDERRATLMNLILNDCDRMNRLISDIASASRLDAELGRIQTTPLDLRHSLQALASIYLREPKVVIENLTETLLVEAHEGRLLQVFQNLVDNALSFSPVEGKVLVEVQAKGMLVETTVSDQGPGIPPAKLETIFDRFYSERPQSEEFGQHSGLGLSICQQIIAAHQGKLWAENILDEQGAITGARFIVQLKLLGVV